jgi:hypothetical protein
MALDDKARRIAEEVMGINVLKQLELVVPDFFDRDYMIVKMSPKPEDQQHQHYPHVVALEPRVMASTHPRYPAGAILDLEKQLAEMAGEGYNVAVSPDKIRGRISTDRRTLENEPFDSLVIAEVRAGEGGFGNPEIFYVQGGALRWGRRIAYSSLDEKIFDEALCRSNVHFAFVPAGETGRKLAAIRKFSDGIVTVE